MEFHEKPFARRPSKHNVQFHVRLSLPSTALSSYLFQGGIKVKKNAKNATKASETSNSREHKLIDPVLFMNGE